MERVAEGGFKGMGRRRDIFLRALTLSIKRRQTQAVILFAGLRVGLRATSVWRRFGTLTASEREQRGVGQAGGGGLERSGGERRSARD